MKTERRSIRACKNMEEPISEGKVWSGIKTNKTKQTTCMVRFSTEKGFSVHICLFGTGSQLRVKQQSQNDLWII